MVSRLKERQDDAKLRVLQILTTKPQMSSRELAEKIGISNGSAYYLLRSLVDNGFVRLASFKKSPQKTKYHYLLTSKGIREKSFITNQFILRKKKEYVLLKEEIAKLEMDLDCKIELNKRT